MQKMPKTHIRAENFINVIAKQSVHGSEKTQIRTRFFRYCGAVIEIRLSSS
jgi:hypothetical protein